MRLFNYFANECQWKLARDHTSLLWFGTSSFDARTSFSFRQELIRIRDCDPDDRVILFYFCSSDFLIRVTEIYVGQLTALKYPDAGVFLADCNFIVVIYKRNFIDFTLHYYRYYYAV